MAQAHDNGIENPNIIHEVQRQDNKYQLNFEYLDIDGKQKDAIIDTSNIYSANVNMNYVDMKQLKENGVQFVFLVMLL